MDPQGLDTHDTLPFNWETVLDLAASELVNSIFRVSNTLLASPEDAEEVTLDVLVQLSRHLHDNREDAATWLNESLPKWLEKTAVKCSKGRAKKRKHHSQNLEELADLHEQLAAESPSPEDTARLVSEYLSYLPKQHRFTIVLRHGFGYDNSRVADLLGFQEFFVVKRLEAAMENCGISQPRLR